MAHYYITTTLPYVNATPHIGFALEIIRADMLARYHGLMGHEVIFNTGTDEHGLKIYQQALKVGMEPQQFVDANAKRFADLKTPLNLTTTHFIRTTNPAHIKAAQEFWKRCEANGDIYKKQYKAKYCVGCELEKTDSELVNGRCSLHPNQELEIVEEENYFFKFSKYQQPLLDLYESRPDFVVPDSRMKEIKTFVAGGLQDFSISRLASKLPWGVPVPGDREHVMYVWFDALVNYISTLGWPAEQYAQWWPGVQIAGKDNLRQQSAMWQAMLMSAGIAPSRQIIINGFINVDGSKMSKSVGNVVDPLEIVNEYGSDALRYFLLRHIPSGEDGDFTWQRFEQLYNGELANDLGNLIQRLAVMIDRYQSGVIGDIPSVEHDEGPYHQAFADYKFDKVVDRAWESVSGINVYLEEMKPWEVAKSDDAEHLREILATAVGSLLQSARLLAPAIPQTAAAIENIFGSGKVTVPKAPLFPKKYLYTQEP